MIDSSTVRPEAQARHARNMLKNGALYFARRPIEAVCDGFFVFYALWSVTWIAGYLLGSSFSTLAVPFIALFPLSLLVLGWLQGPTAIAIQKHQYPRPGEYVTLFAAVVAAVVLTLFLHRPDADDELYLGMAAALLIYATDPLGNVPGFGAVASNVPIPGFEANTQAISAYQPLKAMITYLTGLPLLTSYYLVIPAMMSALTVLVSYRLLRELVPEAWIPAMLFFFLVMVSWGDAHRTLANFGFVRMYQGKAVLVSLIVPAILFYFMYRLERHCVRYRIVMLTAVLISSLGVSRGGLAISPLLIAMLAFASARFDTLRQKILVFWMLLLGSIAIAVVSQDYLTLNPENVVHTPRGIDDSTNNAEMLEFTLGDSLRGYFLLGCAGLSFFFLKDSPVRYLYRNYLVIFFLLLLIPWTSDFLGKTVFLSLSWRWMWVLPVPLLASIAVGGATRWLGLRTNAGDALAVFLLVSVAFVLSSPRLVVSTQNYTEIRWPAAKLPSGTVYLEPFGTSASVREGLLYIQSVDEGL